MLFWYDAKIIDIDESHATHAVSQIAQLFVYLFVNYGAQQFHLPLTRASHFQSLVDFCRSRLSPVLLSEVEPHQ